MRSRHILVLVVLLALLASLTGRATPAAAEDEPLTAVFDWSRPARLVDAPPIDGLLDFHNTASLARPGGYTVRLSGCQSTPLYFPIEIDEEDLIRVPPRLGDPPANPIVKIDWAVTGPGLAEPRLVSVDATSGCSADVVVPEQQTYNVTMTVTAKEGQTAATIATFYVKDYLIAAMGDSYGSGEGNPVIPGRYNVANPYDVIEATWNDRRCHRSQYAGAAQVAKEIEDADRKTSVTFVFVSCSGATIDKGLVGGYAGAVPPEDPKGLLLPPQVEQVRNIVGDRQIDALIISIGGNDVNFAPIASECVLHNECPNHKENDKTLDERFRSDVTSKLPGEYKRLNDAITTAGLNIRNTYITEYPDPTRKDNYDESLLYLVPQDRYSTDNYCAAILYDILPSVDLRYYSAPRMGYVDGEIRWASTTVLPMLNQAVENAAETHGWHFVTGIASEFQQGHGYCAGQNWIRTAEESVNMQGPWMLKPKSIGTLHPTREGHQVYKRQILAAIQPDLELPPLPDNRVVLQPVDGTAGGTPVELTFDNLISEGSTTLTTSAAGPTPPAGYIAANPPMYYNLESTARFSGEVQVCITYTSAAWGSEDMLRLFHYRGDAWVDETISLDAANDVICGRTTTFSPFAIFAMNRPPVVEAGGPYTVDEGSPLRLDATATDPDGHALTYTWTAATHLNNGTSLEDPTYTAPDNAVETLTLRAMDPLGLSAEDTATVTVNNVAPVATLDAPGSVAEGTPFTISLSGATDPSSTDTAAGFTYEFDCGTGFGVPGPAASATCPAVDDGTLTVKGRIGDKDGSVTEYTQAVQVSNVAPTVAVGTPLEGALFAVDDPVNVTASFSDPGNADTHSCAITWDDGSTSAGSVQAGTCSASHAFTQAGVYTLSVAVTDDDGGTGTAQVMVVVYDPSAGFVTGGGWIDSPAGAYVADPTLQGKATFGFVSKYQRGATTPVGHTEFQFRAGGFKFTSTRYQWLVVSGAKAQYKGEGAVNGVPGYGFLLTATDGQHSGGGGVDRFRIKVWDGTGATVYDNKLGASEDIDAADPQAIGGGSIVIHTGR